MTAETFNEWKSRHGPTSSEDGGGMARADMENAWNAALDSAIGALERLRVREMDRSSDFGSVRAGMLESAIDSLRFMKSPRLCSCCGQPVKEEPR